MKQGPLAPGQARRIAIGVAGLLVLVPGLLLLRELLPRWAFLCVLYAGVAAQAIYLLRR
jgi:hypothetical protein